MNVYLIDGRVVILSDAEQRAAENAMRELQIDLESAVRLCVDMRD